MQKNIIETKLDIGVHKRLDIEQVEYCFELDSIAHKHDDRIEGGLAVAGEVLMSISKDERERAIFRSRRIALADQESNKIALVRSARKDEALSIAYNALQMNMSIADIIKLTGLTSAEIESLRKAD